MGFDFNNGYELGQQKKVPGKWAVVCEEYKSQKQKRRKNRCKEQAAAQAAAQQQNTFAEVTPAQAKHRKEYRDANVTCLATEVEHGNVEYKYKIGCITNENRQQQLITQMKFRLSEGSGECFYYIGVEDDGYPRGLDPQELSTSISMLSRMAASLQATACLVEYLPGGFGRTAALLHLKEDAEEDMRATEIRVAVAGSMGSGKSTLVAVLTQGADGRPLLDNGRGSARMPVFRHKHEIESGRTSSISHQVLGYDDQGHVLNYLGVAAPTPADITAAAAQVLNFLDMGGHEKYLKTTLYGFTCMLPDYVLLCVDAPAGVTRITREHLAVAVALEVPTALIITKTDAVDVQQLQGVLRELQLLMAPVLHSNQQRQQLLCPAPCLLHEQQEVLHAECRATSEDVAVAAAVALGADDKQGVAHEALGTGLPVVKSTQQAAAMASKLTQLHRCTAAAAASFQQVTYPVFMVSCVTGQGLSLLHDFLSLLKPATSACSPHQGADPLGALGGRCAAGPAAAAGGSALECVGQQLQASKPPEHFQWVAGGLVSGAGRAVDPASPARLGAESSSQLWVAEEQAACASNSMVSTRGVRDAAAGAATPGHFQVVHTFDVEGVGWVVSGIAVSGTFEVGQQLLWGPTSDGGFSPVTVSCIQRSHLPVRQVQAGQTATLALQPPGAISAFAHSKEALMSAAVAAQAAAEEQAAREAAAAAAAANIAFGPFKRCPQPVQGGSNGGQVVGVTGLVQGNSRGRSMRVGGDLLPDRLERLTDELPAELQADGDDGDVDDNGSGVGGILDTGDSDFDGLGSFTGFEEDGAVLLDTAVAPHTYWEFEALLVLLGGHWPARGLLSGCWPPDDVMMAQQAKVRQFMSGGSLPGRHSPSHDETAPGVAADSIKTDKGVRSQALEGAGADSGRASGRQRTKRYDYAYVIHCNSIRQIARVMSMQEVRQEHGDDISEGEEGQHLEQQQRPVTAHRTPAEAVAQQAQPQQLQTFTCNNTPCLGRSSILSRCCGHPGWGLSASIQAAAALLQGTRTGGGSDRDAGWRSPPGEGTTSSSSSSSWGANCRLPSCPDLGTVVSVRFRFTHRPEWLQTGARLIARDRSDGHVAAAGFVTQLLDAHQQQQPRQQPEGPSQ
eukprot:gene8727-8908_t